MNILILNGPNINLLGNRETDIYGNISFDKLEEIIKNECINLGFKVEFFQSNSEGEIIDKIQKSAGKIDFIIANLGGYTHTSIAIRDAFLAVKIPFIEVHLSNIYKREAFRHKSFFSDIAMGVIAGFKEYSYVLALHAVRALFSK
jgi:3-dehydroquinate dehydratase-2